MKLEITIADSVTLAGTVQELFSSLTPEQRVAIATDIMAKFLTEPHQGERLARENTVVNEMKMSNVEIYVNYGRKRASECTDAQILQSDEYRTRMKDWKSTREIMIETITKCAVDTFRSSVQEFVKNDPQLQQVMKVTLDVVREKFPEFAHDATIAWFCTNMSAMSAGMQAALMKAGNAESMALHINQRLSQLKIGP